MSMIITANGWKQLVPKNFILPRHTPSLLEREGIATDHNGAKAMADYANAFGNGVYFTYKADGTSYQSKPAIHPIQGMF